MLRFLGYTLAFVICVLVITRYFQVRLQRWSTTRLSVQETVLEYPRGTSLKTLSSELETAGVISNPLLFRFWVKYFADYQKFQAGTYRFDGGYAPREVVAAFTMGDTYEPVVFEYTIPEGFTLKQTVNRLVAKGIGSKEEFEQLISDPDFLESLKVPSKSLEGFLFPATYSFVEVPDAARSIAVAVEEFWNRIPPDYLQQIEQMGLDLLGAVTFASLIELETPHDDEREFVSEVIWRRLRAKAALAIDATIIYGIKDYAGNLSRKHLRDAKNPYNTRIHPGLPPTPIGSPSTESLLAVLNPSNKGYYYYVVDVKTGNRHHFSKSLKEHNRYVRELVRYSKLKRRSSKNEK